jgi:hypothetical protein
LHADQRTGASCFIRVLARDTGDVSNDNEWYWDLNRKVAVPASERGSSDHVLGPYASRHEAENWKSIAERRNDDWAEDDEEWNRAGEDE